MPKRVFLALKTRASNDLQTFPVLAVKALLSELRVIIIIVSTAANSDSQSDL